MKAFDLTPELCAEKKLFYAVGGDIYLLRYAEKVAMQLVPSDEIDYSVRIFGKIESLAAVSEAMMTSPFFGGVSIVIVRDGQYKCDDKEVKDFTASLNNAYVGAILIIENPSFFTPELKKRFTAIEADAPDAYEAVQLLKKARPNIRFAAGAAERLVSYANRDLLRIMTEADKLYAYKAGETVTAEDVKILVSSDAEIKIFELSNALLDKNNGKAAELFDDFISKGIDYAHILGMLISQYRRIVFAAMSTEDDAALAKMLGTKEYAIKKAREAARRHTKDALNRSLKLLEDAEYKFKSGAMSEENAVKTAFVSLMLI